MYAREMIAERTLIKVVAVLLSLASACGFDRPPPLGDDASVEIDAATIDAIPPDCTPNEVVCTGDQLITCSSEGMVESTERCALGCHVEEPRCIEVEPSNGLAAHLADAANAPDVTLDDDAVINTDDGSITGTTAAVPTAIVGAAPVEILVVKVRSMTARDVRVVGSRALAIVSHGDIFLNGVIDVSASYQFGGAGNVRTGGGCSAGNGTSAGDAGLSGGGGGGFGTAGGNGGSAGLTDGGSGGQLAGSANLVPLRGGCPGGWYGGASGPPATEPTAPSPGAGGGAVQLSSRTKIALTTDAAITANGGSAKGYTGGPPLPFCLAGVPCGAGAGGGSGGGILLEAPVVEVSGSAALVANGGAGHCSPREQPASPTISAVPAPGHNCGTWMGGSGFAGTTAATAGTTENDGPTGAGGGGGGGRVRVNLPSGATFSPSANAVLSPQPTVGVIASR